MDRGLTFLHGITLLELGRCWPHFTGKDCEPRPASPHVYPPPPRHGLPTSKTGVKTVCLGFSHFNSRMALIPLSLSYISLDLSMSLLSNEKAHLFRPLMLIVSLSPFIFTILQVFQLFVCLNVWPLGFVLRLVHFHSCGMKEQTNVRVKMVKIWFNQPDLAPNSLFKKITYILIS